MIGSPRRAPCLLRPLRLVAVALVASGCGVDSTGSPPPVPFSIALEPRAVPSTWVGESRRLLAEVRDRNGTILSDPALSRTSSNPSAVTVSPEGLAEARAAGEAGITAGLGPCPS